MNEKAIKTKKKGLLHMNSLISEKRPVANPLIKNSEKLFFRQGKTLTGNSIGFDA